MSAAIPLPDPAAKSLSDQLLALIKAEIVQNGQITFERYMSLALYAPGLGYYRNGSTKIGEAGDFITAPEISPLFSKCLANQCAEVLSTIPGADILEFGAGRGVMAADILLHLKALDQLPTHYYILELSAQLQAVQKQTIAEKAPELLDSVVWLDALPAEPINGIVLANEVLDAMPVTQFCWDDGLKSCGVTIKADQLVSCVLPGEQVVALSEITFAPGYISEVNQQVAPWIQSLSDSLASGVVLLIDYGFPRHEYYHPDRNQGTLMCHYRHLAHADPFLYPGLQDITAHVDFTAVAEAAVNAEFSIAGYTNQAAFLMNTGLLSLLDQSADEAQRFAENQAVLKLTMPSEMGELFKVMGLTKSYEKSLMGFSSMNQVARL